MRNLEFESGISSWGDTKKLPYAFTELGVAMLSSVLNSKRAVMVNIEKPHRPMALQLGVNLEPYVTSKKGNRYN